MTRFTQNGTTTNQNAPGYDPDLDDLDFKDEDGQGFILLYKSGVENLTKMVTEGKLLNRDIIVLLTYIHHADWRNGRCRLTAQKAAEIIGYKVATLQGSVKRLKKANLLVPIRDSKTGERLLIVSPYIVKAGSSQSRGYLIKLYHEAVAENEPCRSHPLPSSAGDDLRVYGKDNAAWIEDEEMEWLNAKDSTTDITSSPAGDDLDDLEDDSWADEL